jgi:hypothetical protein
MQCAGLIWLECARRIVRLSLLEATTPPVVSSGCGDKSKTLMLGYQMLFVLPDCGMGAQGAATCDWVSQVVFSCVHSSMRCVEHTSLAFHASTRIYHELTMTRSTSAHLVQVSDTISNPTNARTVGIRASQSPISQAHLAVAEVRRQLRARMADYEGPDAPFRSKMSAPPMWLRWFRRCGRE